MRRAARQDGNHQSIEEVFKDAGCEVFDTSRLGDGFPDLIVSVPGINLLVEVKNGDKPPSKRKLTPKEESFHQRWKGPLVTVQSVSDAQAAVYMLLSQTGDVSNGGGDYVH